MVTRAEALDALIRSGYLLESRIESVLRAADFRVEANTLVPDPSGQRRELDLWAGWARCHTFGPDGESFLSVELVIECVNAPQPVAFITKERPARFLEREDRWDALKLIGNPPEVGSRLHDPWSWLAHQLDVNRYHHYNTKRIATQYCSFQKKQNASEWMALHRDEDHQVFRKLCYATDHYVRDWVTEDYASDGPWILGLIYPVLVVQGELYDVRPLRRSARVVSSDHVQFCCTQEIRGQNVPFQIDVITERYFPKYLDLVFRDLRLMHKRLVTKHEEYAAFRRLREENHQRYEASLAARGGAKRT